MIKIIKHLLAHRENKITAFVFMALAISFGAFITRLPDIKDRLDLSESELGAALFFLPLGAATLLPFYSKIIARFGERKTTSGAIIGFLIVIILPGLTANLYWLMASLYLLGLAMGLTDVAMNAEAAEIERAKSRSIMSACHGFFSLGGMFGALLGALFIFLEVGLTLQMSILALILILFLLPSFKHLIDVAVREPHKGFQFPPMKVIVYAAIGLCVMMSEGGITDWSTIYLRDNLNLSAEFAGFGFAGFSLATALMRFKGDELQGKLGGRFLVILGLVIGIIGLTLTLFDNSVIVIIGFSVSGLGFSVIVPILYSATAKIEGLNPSSGIATVASSGYIGMLIGPVIIGFIAEEYGLNNGFVFLLGLTILALALSLKSFR
ncbi:MFS transporter [Roseivirga sp.]|uniref:MFS transporter n=1 Tax=Roseivirga sp. TaxID=1964215 RepID=UPI003B8DC667